MTSEHGGAPGTEPIMLLSIQGTLAPTSLEAAREIHNQTAGSPEAVAGARALGDLSHMVYVPLDPGSNGAGPFLILDQWNNLEGLNQFFADPQVQQGGAMIFSDRDPVVWTPAEGFVQYHFPTPRGENDRFVGIIRGHVHSREAAQALHNRLMNAQVNQARQAGYVSHETYFRLTPPGTPASTEFLAVDVWSSASGMQKSYDDPRYMEQFMSLFAHEPAASIWRHPAGEWIEW